MEAMEGQLEVTATTAPAGVRLRGEADMSVLPTLELVADVLRYCPGDVVVDVSRLTFIDVGGLRVFERAASALRSDGRRLRFAGCPLPIRRLIEVLGWTSLLQAVEEVGGDGNH